MAIITIPSLKSQGKQLVWETLSIPPFLLRTKNNYDDGGVETIGHSDK